jgi:hypothetical protein
LGQVAEPNFRFTQAIRQMDAIVRRQAAIGMSSWSNTNQPKN